MSRTEAERFSLNQRKTDLLTGAQGILRHLIFFALKTGWDRRDSWSQVERTWISKRGHMRVISWKGKRTTIRHVPILTRCMICWRIISKCGEYVFRTRWTPLESHGCRSFQLMKLVDRLGIPDFVFHDLRHTFASDFLSKGGTLSEFEDDGHSATTMTETLRPSLERASGGAIKVFTQREMLRFCYVDQKQTVKETKVVDYQLTPR